VSLLRAGISDAALQQTIIEAIARKPQRHEFNDRSEQMVRFMSSTGG
jgi:cyclic pyranopterin phosphate synthase